MSEARTSAGAATRIALVMLGMSALLNMYSTQPILGEVARWAGVGVETAAWTVSATTAGVALVAPWAGMLSDAWGRRRVILSAVLAMALLGLPGLVVNNFWLLLAMRFAQGMCCPFIFAVVVAYLGEEYAARQAARLNALYIAGTALGGFAGRMVAALVSEWTGQWRLSFLANTVVLLVTWAVAWFFLPPERRFVPQRWGRSTAVTGLSPGSFLSRWRLPCTILVGATLLFQQTASFTFASLRLGEPPFSLSTSATGMVFLVFLLPMVTTPLSGRMMQRWGELRVFVLFQLVGAVGIAVTLIPALPAMLCGLALSCVGVFAGQAAGTSMAGRLLPGARSAAVGWYLSGYYLGGALGAVAPGRWYAEEGWGAVVAILLATVAAGTALGGIAWAGRGPVRRSRADPA